MKVIIGTALLTLAPSAALGAACNADNVLRALKANSASASPFCSTYTRPPPNQPLPTYVSAYPASRVSSACSCFITPSSTMTTSTTSKTSTSTSTTATSTSTWSTTTSKTSTTSSTTTTSTTPSPNPTDFVCTGELVRNGGFEVLTNGKPDPWVFAPATHPGSGMSTNAGFGTGSSHGNYGYLSISNPPPPTYGQSTYLEQKIPSLCSGVDYNLTYSSQINISGGQPRVACGVSIYLQTTGEIVHVGAPNGQQQPFQYETRTEIFTYNGRGGSGDTLGFELSCNAPGGGYTVDDVSLVGLEDPGDGGCPDDICT